MKKLIKTIKDTLSILSSSKGFTLLELLVVVLIIGILTAIALPQYKMAVTKAKVASILPLMRRWKDALTEYKLRHGDYNVNDASALGVNWPSDWKFGTNGNNACGDTISCHNDYWHDCTANEESDGFLYCYHHLGGYEENSFYIRMYPVDYEEEILSNKITCKAYGDEAHRICKALGGTLPEGEEEGEENEYILY